MNEAEMDPVRRGDLVMNPSRIAAINSFLGRNRSRTDQKKVEKRGKQGEKGKQARRFEHGRV